ncbi:hypothetical protein [Chelativorans salis]|uniref:Uncharacterized protein n=1 Tax=Chelativorans salis TaxID=2978478 RepID=A0ABT2LLL1_9HYPH|nr:hypothetical protein [Chelativorans sp. EGI FJ00035]MCT7375472.1 hypothetical protein [Chelativorans sp. EGI FJ00035]
MKLVSKGVRLACLAVIVSTLAACGTSEPASAPGLRLAIGNSLPGAKGLGVADQDRIDDTVAGGCVTGVYTSLECERHTKASAERRAELAQR